MLYNKCDSRFNVFNKSMVLLPVLECSMETKGVSYTIENTVPWKEFVITYSAFSINPRKSPGAEV